MCLSNTLVKPATEPARANVLGVGIHVVDMADAVVLIEAAISEGRKGYVCLTGVHGVMEAQRNDEFHGILDRALLVAPDGMPTVWVGRTQGFHQMRRVYGPDLMLEICRQSVEKRITHFLYGGNPGVTTVLRNNLEKRYPGIKIVGTYTPPFRPLFPNEQRELEDKIARLSPEIVWVGLSTAKTRAFYGRKYRTFFLPGHDRGWRCVRHSHRKHKRCSAMDEAGGSSMGPIDYSRSHFRLGKRYLVNNPAFSVENRSSISRTAQITNYENLSTDSTSRQFTCRS